MLRNTQARVNLAAIAHNIDAARARVGANTRIMAVVKAEAYGHGAVAVSRYLEQRGAVDFLGVAIVEEGIALREAGISMPVLVLGAADAEHIRAGVAHDLALTAFDDKTLLLAAEYAAQFKRTAAIHIKLDTGMNRIGVKSLTEFESLIDIFRHNRRLKFEGLFTHFAKSEERDGKLTHVQAKRFADFAKLARAAGFAPLLHAANSGAVFTNAGAFGFDMVRLGISMYGYHPDLAQSGEYALRPALSWHTNVAHVKTVPAGEGVSYGHRFIAPRETVVATLPVGYGDGYKRCLSGKSEVLIRGRRVPQIGTVCMDQIMIDVTELADVKVGDAVVLLGEQGDECITADELARLADSISYEILLSVSARVPRVYFEESRSCPT